LDPIISFDFNTNLTNLEHQIKISGQITDDPNGSPFFLTKELFFDSISKTKGY
jgi:hypothetical protein